MSFIDDILRGFGMGPKPDVRTPEERLEELRQQADDAEKLSAQTKEAFELKKRIAQANFERQKVLSQANAGKKQGLSRTQTIVGGIIVLVVIILFVKSCM